MSGTKYLADTNAVLYMLSGNECMCPYLKDDFAVSAITFMELLSFPGIQEEEEKAIRAFLKECELLQIDSEIMEQTITLRRAYKIKLPDAIIAATAITHSMLNLSVIPSYRFSFFDFMDSMILSPSQ